MINLNPKINIPGRTGRIVEGVLDYFPFIGFYRANPHTNYAKVLGNLAIIGGFTVSLEGIFSDYQYDVKLSKGTPAYSQEQVISAAVERKLQTERHKLTAQYRNRLNSKLETNTQ